MEQLKLFDKGEPLITVEFKRQYKKCVRSFPNKSENEAIAEAHEYMCLLCKDKSVNQAEMHKGETVIARWVR